MTTLCLCDWVETGADRERRLALLAFAAPEANDRSRFMASGPAAPVTDSLVQPRDVVHSPNQDQIP